MDQLEEENEFLKEKAEEMRNEYEVNVEDLKKEIAFLKQEKENLRKTIDFESKIQREELDEIKADAAKNAQMKSEYINLRPQRSVLVFFIRNRSQRTFSLRGRVGFEKKDGSLFFYNFC